MLEETSKAKGDWRFLELETAVDQARTKNEPDSLILALIELGLAYLDSGNVPKALTQYEKALTLAKENNEEVLEARLWGYKGICLTRLGNSHFAQIAFYKSYKMAKALHHTPLLIDALTQIGSLQLETGQKAKAISRLEQAHGLALSIGDDLRAMNLAGKVGGIFFSMDAQEKALEYYVLARQLAQKLDQPQAECAYLLNIGNVLLTGDEQAAAREHFEEALNIATELNNVHAEISALSSLMRTYMAEDKVSMVALYGESALRLAQALGAPGLEIANINLFTTYLVERGYARRALPHLQRGLEIATGSEDWAWQLTFYHQLGYAYYELGELDAALAAYESGLQRARQLQDKTAMGQLYGRLSAVLADKEMLTEAVTAARQALAIGQELDDSRLVGEQQIMLAFAFSDLDDLEQARSFCQEAVATYRTLGEESLLRKAETLLLSLETAI